MAGISDHSTFFRESLERVPWDEPSSLDIVFLKELQEPAYSYATGEETWILLQSNPAIDSASG